MSDNTPKSADPSSDLSLHAVVEPGYWAWVPEAFAALRHRNYRLYGLGQIVSLIGTWMQRTAQGWLVTDLVLEIVAKSQVAAVTNWFNAGTSPVRYVSPSGRNSRTPG